MTTAPTALRPERSLDERGLLEQAFSRASGSPLVTGNRIRLLRDAAENYPAWLEAIANARHTVHFETYIIWDDKQGAIFADALTARARDGVRVRVLYDWLGAIGKTPRRFWDAMLRSGADVRAFNPPRLASPLGWIHRDHRKALIVDGEVGFIAGLCVGQQWIGSPEQGIAPWRDTGVELRGPAVAAVERAFARTWATAGSSGIEDSIEVPAPPPAGDVGVRIIASEPWTTGMMRLEQLMAAAARERLWITDAYFAGTPDYVQALRSAALDGVDVRLLVPGTTDIPLVQALSRVGYRPLLEAGIRVFEWRGSMMHAKTAVTDDRWARVGSSNLNVASWIGNWEIDVAVDDPQFGKAMSAMYLEDLANSTEIVLSEARVADRRRIPRWPHTSRRTFGSAGRIAAGAVRIGHTASVMFTERRVLGSAEARVVAIVGLACVALAALILFWPRLLTIPFGLVLAWIGVSALLKARSLRREREERGEGRRRVVEAGSE